MRVARSSLFALLLSVAPVAPAVTAAALLVPTDAQASVSIAVGFDALVKDADSIGVAIPIDATCAWEDGRIYTYTRIKIDQGVAGELGSGAEGTVRTLGGVVGKIGQLVDGEPVLTTNKPSLLFLRKFKAGGTWEVAARAQGQYPLQLDEAHKTRRVMRSAAVGLLFPPRTSTTAVVDTSLTRQSVAGQTTTAQTASVRLAGEALHDRPFDEVAREIAASWKRLHPATDRAASESKK